MSDIITVGPDHPCWKAYGDDDWNGATFANWLTTLDDKNVRLFPPDSLPPETVKGVHGAVERVAYEAVLVESVHILKHGFAICGEMKGTPNEWPKGHLWVGFDDVIKRENKKKWEPTATCPACRTAQGLAPLGKTAGE